MSNTVTYVEHLPKCDICNAPIAKYDARIPITGQWGNLCASCFCDKGCELGLGKGQLLKLRASKPKPAKMEEPSIDELETMMMDGVALATDGCEVEPDGTCTHGCKSWLMVMGLI